MNGKVMNVQILIGCLAAASVGVSGCSKKKSDSTDSSSGTSVNSLSTGKGAVDLAIASLSSIPAADTFLTSSSDSAALAAALALNTRPDGYSLSSGTAPKFTDLSTDLATYLTGDVAATMTALDQDLTSHDWADMKTQIGKFFDAEAKCAVMEHTARIVERLREDTAALCLLQAVGPIGNEVLKWVSGAPIEDLTTVFTPDATDKILQIGMTDKGQPHYEIVQISGSTTNPSGYHAVYSTCNTATKKAFRQNTVDLDNTTGILTFTSARDGSQDDHGVRPSATFSLTGTLTKDAAGNAIPDVTKVRTVKYAGVGAFGQLTSTEQGLLNIQANELSATFFSKETGNDKAGNAGTRTDKTALDVQYTGSGTADLVIYQGAGHSQLSMSGTIGATAISNSNDHTIGFTFDDTVAPNYATEATSTFLDNVAAIDFTTDAMLSQAEPTGPDMATIDSTACTATPTTLIGYVAKPETSAVYTDAVKACAATPAEKAASMCDGLRDDEHRANVGMQARKVATGSATE